tara:strand:- start:4751 stop:5371 length:621 start_codon:yes stop_codon:yes gene_type:complete
MATLYIILYFILIKLNENRFDNYTGKNTLIVGGILNDNSINRTIFLANLIKDAIDNDYGNRISIIEMCPDKTSFKNVKFAAQLSEYIDNLDEFNYIKPELVHWPRIYANNPKDAIKLSVENSRNLIECLDKYRKRPTKILFINELNFYLHMGTMHWLMKAIDKSTSFIGTCFRSKFPYSDYNTGISRRERRLIDKLTHKVDNVITL